MSRPTRTQVLAHVVTVLLVLGSVITAATVRPR